MDSFVLITSVRAVQYLYVQWAAEPESIDFDKWTLTHTHKQNHQTQTHRNSIEKNFTCFHVKQYFRIACWQ